MDRVVADGKVVLVMLALAAYVYFIAYKFIMPRPAEPPCVHPGCDRAATPLSLMRILVTLLLGVAVGLLLFYLLHVPPFITMVIAVIGLLVSTRGGHKAGQDRI